MINKTSRIHHRRRIYPSCSTYTDWCKETCSVYETWYALDIIAKEHDSNNEFKEIIQKKLIDLKFLDNDDKSTVTNFVPFIVKIAVKMKSMGPDEDKNGRQLMKSHLDLLLMKKRNLVWSSLKMISEMNELECEKIFPNLSLFEEFITEALEPEFIDRKPNEEKNKLLFQFFDKFLPYLTKDMVANSSIINKMERLLRHLNLMGKEEWSLTLFKVCTKGDELLSHFVDVIDATADSFFHRHQTSKSSGAKTDSLNSKPATFKRMTEYFTIPTLIFYTIINYAFTNLYIKNDSQYLEQRQFVNLINTLMVEVFKIRVEYKRSYDGIIRAMLKAHFYDLKSVLLSLEKSDQFSREQREEIYDEVKKIAPIQNHLGGFSKWFEIMKIFTFLSALNQIADYLLDWGITVEYFDWLNYVSDYNCTFWTKYDDINLNDTSSCTWKKYDNSFSCQSNFNNGSYNCNYDKFFENEGNSSYCNDFQNESTNYTSACGVVLLNNLLPFLIGQLILLGSHVLQFVVMCFHHSKFENLICYILGYCCLESYQKKKKNGYSIRDFTLIIVCGFLLQFFTKVFATIIMPIHLHQAKLNRDKLRNLKLLDSNEKLALFRSKFECNHCKDCSAKKCICFRCGHLNRESDQTTNQDEIFNEKVGDLHSNMQELGRLDRLVTGCLENTYMPLVQLSLILPLVVEKLNSSQSASDDITKTVTIWRQLFFTILSISSSLIGLSTTAVDLHFKRDSKEFRGNELKTKLIYHIAMILQISSRLLLFSGFGLFVWIDWYHHRLMPLYLITAIIVHCLIVLCLKLLARIYYGQQMNFKDCGISSFLSAYTYVVWDVATGDESSAQNSKTALPYWNPKMECEELIKDLDNEKDPLRSSCSSSLQNLSKFDDSKRAKSLERTLFCFFIWIQHITMSGMMTYFWLFNLGPKGFSTAIFVAAVFAMFVVGHGIELYYHIMLNPFAKNMNFFTVKKYIFYIFGVCLLIVILVLIFVYLRTLASRIIFAAFILIVLLIGVIFKLCGSSDQKKQYHDEP